MDLDPAKITMKHAREMEGSGVDTSPLFATVFDPTTKSLVHTLFSLGMSKSEYHHLLSHAQNYMETCTDIETNDAHDDKTVEEMRMYTELSDLVVIGLLAYQLFENKDFATKKMTRDIVAKALDDLVNGVEQ